jgi:hypothetical protein
VLNDHFAFYRGEHGTETYPDVIRADVVWLPSGLPSVERLIARGWTRAFESDRSVVLARRACTTHPPALVVAAERMFPGP